MGYKDLGNNWNRKWLDDVKAMLKEIYDGNFLTKGALSGDVLQTNSVDTTIISDRAVTEEKINDRAVTYEKINPYSPNLFILPECKKGYIFNFNDNGKEMVFSSQTYALTSFIQVEQNVSYTMTNGYASNLIYGYDDNGNGISGSLIHGNLKTETFSFKITNPNVKKIRVNIDYSKSDLDSFVISKSDVFNDSSAFKRKQLYWLEVDESQIKKRDKNSVELLQDKYKNKTIVLFGDSITYWDSRYSWFDSNYFMIGYPTHIRNKLNANVINNGVAGNTLLDTLNKIKSADLSKADACILTSGTNDSIKKVKVGTINDEIGQDTFYSQLKESIKVIYSKNQKIKIYLMTAIKNQVGNDITPYANAIREIGALYGIPVLSLDRNVQINEFNASILLVDGTHPNNDGYQIYADCVIPFLINN